MIRALAALFVLSSVLTFAILISGPGCNTGCYNTFDCPPGSFCDGTHHCVTQCEIDADCRNNMLGFRCSQPTGRCIERPESPTGTTRPPIVDDNWDGFNDPPISGRTYIISRLGIADEDIGLNVDGMCDGSDCEENVLGLAGGYANELVAQGVQYGDTLLVLELAGLAEDFEYADRKVTVKLYGAYDADEPPRSNNNFRVPEGETGCCAFLIDSQSILNQQATARFRARIDRGKIIPIEHTDAAFTLAIGRPPHQRIHLASAAISGRVTGGATEIHEGLLGGAIPMADLATVDATEFCLPGEPCTPGQLIDRTVLDIVSALIAQPDIDLDGDGQECTLRTSGGTTLDACCDGNGARGPCFSSSGECASGRIVPPLVADRPASCAEDDRIRDGYSVALSFDAVPATVVGYK
jgi:hypothetical protein